MEKDTICNPCGNGRNNARNRPPLDSGVIAGHIDLAFRDRDENATSQIIGATYGRKNPIKKEEE
jgi:hypothetical protein